MFKTESFYKTRYLLHCDLVNKYLLENIRFIPAIKEMKMEVSLKDLKPVILNLETGSNKEDVLRKAKIKLYILFFLFLDIPYLKYISSLKEKNPTKQSNENHEIENFTFNFLYSCERKINKCLFKMLVESLQKGELEKRNIKLSVNENLLNAKFNVPLYNLYELYYLLNFFFPYAFWAKDIFINIKLVLYSPSKRINKNENLLRQMSYLWLN